MRPCGRARHATRLSAPCFVIIRRQLAGVLALSIALATVVAGLVATSASAQAPASGVTLFGKVQDAESKAGLPYLTEIGRAHV